MSSKQTTTNAYYLMLSYWHLGNNFDPSCKVAYEKS